MVMTLGLTVFVDLVTAVAIGLIIAGMAHARQLEGLELDNVLSVPLLDRTFFAGLEGASTMDEYSARVGLVQLRGAFTVASSHKLVDVIAKDIREHEIVLFDFSKATYLDDSAGMLIGQLLDVAAKGDTEVIVTGVSGAVAKTLETLDILAARRGRVRSSTRWTRPGKSPSASSEPDRRIPPSSQAHLKPFRSVLRDR